MHGANFFAYLKNCGPSGREGSPTTAPSATPGAVADFTSASQGSSSVSEINPDATVTPDASSYAPEVMSSYKVSDAGGGGIAGSSVVGGGDAESSFGGGAADVSGAPRGIFSSPELSVNTENLDELKPELSGENKSRIAAAFSQTDATRQHDQLSEQMGGQMPGQTSGAAPMSGQDDPDVLSGVVLPAGGLNSNSGTRLRSDMAGGSRSNMTSSTATGDIQLGGRKKKSKLLGKLPLLIGAAVVVLAAGVVVMMGMLSGGGESENPESTALSASDVINFANYALAEDAQQVLANGYTNARTYRLEHQIKLAQLSGESNIEYFNSLNETFNTVYNKVQNIFNTETAFTSDDLITMRDQITVIRQFVSGNMLTAMEISSIYLAQGNGIMQQVAETEALKYASLENNSIAKEYAAVIRETALMISLTYGVYDQYKCIEDGAINAECVAAIPDGVFEPLDWSSDSLVEFIYNAACQVERGTFTIYWSINETS